jgi:hypothetical protein
MFADLCEQRRRPPRDAPLCSVAGSVPNRRSSPRLEPAGQAARSDRELPWQRAPAILAGEAHWWRRKWRLAIMRAAREVGGPLKDNNANRLVLWVTHLVCPGPIWPQLSCAGSRIYVMSEVTIQERR